MTVTYTKQAEKFEAKEILWSSPALIRALLREAIISQVECRVDMTLDTQEDATEEDITRNSVEECLRGAKEGAKDFIADVIGDLQRVLTVELAAMQFKARVTAIKYDSSGVEDIDVDVTFN